MAAAAPTPWPTSKFKSASPATRGAILLCTGAMNPIHCGHIAMLHAALDRLRSEGIEVLGSYVSPSHDTYVQPKAAAAGSFGLSGQFRLELARRAVADEPLVDVAAWEALQPGRWPDFPVVCEELQRRVSVRVYYVCGTDHATKCGLWSGMGEIGVVVVPRESERPMREAPAKRVYVAAPAQGEAAGFSSTRVRAALEARDHAAVGHFLAAAAARFLLRPSADEHAAFASDFGLLGIGVDDERS